MVRLITLQMFQLHLCISWTTCVYLGFVAISATATVTVVSTTVAVAASVATAATTTIVGL